MARCSDCKDCIHVRTACAVDNRIVNGKGCWSYFTTAKKEESKLTYTLEQLMQKWREGERGEGIYRDSDGYKLTLDGCGICWEQSRTYIAITELHINDTYTRCEKITECDLIGALQMHKDGTANWFRSRSKSGAVTQWETNPLLLASGVAWTTLTFECKKEG